ncbi:MAG: hypothetical protein LBT70_00005 [Holosporaceae bacterium]|nr:hypothetical protein [Holosporaceae bacterium]
MHFTLEGAIFVPVKISTRKGRRAVVHKSGDRCVNTPFSRLLVRAYMLESQLQRNIGITLKEFCEINKISARYVRSILSMNKLSPKIKNLIMTGYCPSHLSVNDIRSKKFPILWKEQEAVFVR